MSSAFERFQAFAYSQFASTQLLVLRSLFEKRPPISTDSSVVRLLVFAQSRSRNDNTRTGKLRYRCRALAAYLAVSFPKTVGRSGTTSSLESPDNLKPA